MKIKMKSFLQFSFCLITLASYFLLVKSVEVYYPCNSNLDCHQDIGPYAFCLQGNCICHVNSTNDDVECGKLKPVFFLDEECELSLQCTIGASHCDPESRKCKCDESFIASGRKQTCLKIAQKLHDLCEIDRQCHVNIPSSNCVRNKCGCRIGYHEYNGRCWKSSSLHYQCNNTIDCMSVANSTCEENQCQCESGFVPSSNGRICMKMAQDFNVENSCTENEQCAHYGNYAYCNDSKCQCHYAYHYVPHLQQCTITRRLYETCDQIEECFHESEENKMICLENQCKCATTYYEVKGICVDSGANLKPTLTFSLISLMVIKLFV